MLVNRWGGCAAHGLTSKPWHPPATNANGDKYYLPATPLGTPPDAQDRLVWRGVQMDDGLRLQILEASRTVSADSIDVSALDRYLDAA